MRVLISLLSINYVEWYEGGPTATIQIEEGRLLLNYVLL